MRCQLTFRAVLALVVASCSEPSAQLGEIELPNEFNQTKYLSAKFEDLNIYCQLLEHQYAAAKPDELVIAELERLVTKKTLIVRAFELDVKVLDKDSVRGLLAVLKVAENKRFGVALRKNAVLKPNIEYLRGIQSELEDHYDYLQSQMRVD